jgi:hypothetical protein
MSLASWGVQEVVAAIVTKDPSPHRVLESLQELGGETGGLVEVEAGGWARGTLARIDPLKEAIDDTQVEVIVRIERRAEPMQEAHSSERRGSRGGGTGLPQGGLKSTEQDVEDGRGGPGPVIEEGPEALGDGEHELAHGDVGEEVVHEVGGGLGHALSITGRAGTSSLAGKGHQEIVATA